MAEPSTPPEAVRPQVFISYSHADKRRVAGLVTLLKGLRYTVFIDDESIEGGQLWADEIDAGLRATDVLLVFWTRHAAHSDYVHREYERFATQFPDRRLVPVRGDRTPLPPRLQARHSPDFCPLLNELFETVRDLKEKRVRNSQIRAIVLRRLEEEEIHLPRDLRPLLFGLFGILPWAMILRHCLQYGYDPLVDLLQRQRDRLVGFLQHRGTLLVDQSLALTATLSALPAAYYYTAGVAITAGFLTCHGAARGLDTIAYKKGYEAAQVQVQQQARLLSQRMTALDAEVEARVAQGIAQAQREQPELFPVDVRLDQSGTDACDARGMICVSMARRRVVDINHKFFGYTTPTCSATVIRQSSCLQGWKTNYALKGVVLRRSPEAAVGVEDLSIFDHICLSNEKEKLGIFHFANCVRP